MANIIVKNWEHVNRSLPGWDTPGGRYIKNKDHYDRAMKESGMVSYEKMQQQVENKKLKDYHLSDKARSIINSASMVKDRKGNVKLSDRQIDAMRDIGAVGKKIPEYMKLPKETGKGGFYDSDKRK